MLYEHQELKNHNINSRRCQEFQPASVYYLNSGWVSRLPSRPNIRHPSRMPMPMPKCVAYAENYEVANTFSSYANWLIRGRLMLGRYPFVEPSRARWVPNIYATQICDVLKWSSVAKCQDFLVIAGSGDREGLRMQCLGYLIVMAYLTCNSMFNTSRRMQRAQLNAHGTSRSALERRWIFW